MLPTTISKKEYEEIYRLLDTVTLTKDDCGKLCNSACCQTDAAEDLGIYLMPGEEALFTGEEDWLDWFEEDTEEFAFPESWKGSAYFLQCRANTNCPRENRPIQCRTFPMTPHLDENDKLTLIYNDLELPYYCPIIEDRIPISSEFVRITTQVWERLIKDPLIYDLVKMDSQERIDFWNSDEYKNG